MLKKPCVGKRRFMLPIEQIRVSKLNWDRHRSPEGIETLADSIEKVGQLHPITVRPLGKIGRVFELIAGRRRYEALKQLGEKKAEVRVVKCSDEMAELISLHENLAVEKPATDEWARGLKRAHEILEQHVQQQMEKHWEDYKPQNRDGDLAASPNLVSRHRVSKLLQQPTGRRKTASVVAREELAEQIGRSPKTVHRYLKFEEDLTTGGLRALKREKISLVQAERLSKLPLSEQYGMLDKYLEETNQATRNREMADACKSNATEYLRYEFEDVTKACRELSKKVADLIQYTVDRDDIDWASITALKATSVKGCVDRLTGPEGLLTLVEQRKSGPPVQTVEESEIDRSEWPTPAELALGYMGA